MLGALFAAAGVMRLLPVPFDMAMFASWGLPAWLRTVVGIAELTAGLLLLIRRTRPIGAIGVFTIMVSAGTTHAVLGHGVDIAIFVNGIPALLAATSARPSACPWTARGTLPTWPTFPARSGQYPVPGTRALNPASWSMSGSR